MDEYLLTDEEIEVAHQTLLYSEDEASWIHQDRAVAKVAVAKAIPIIRAEVAEEIFREIELTKIKYGGFGSMLFRVNFDALKKRYQGEKK